MSERVMVTGAGAICASGKDPQAIWQAVSAGRSAIAPIAQWDASGWPRCLAGEVSGFDPRALVSDRKIHKLLGRTDFLGLYAAEQALAESRLLEFRAGLEAPLVEHFNDQSGIFAASGGGVYRNQYDFLPLLTATGGELRRFGEELPLTVTPMWLLRVLPNNVLCHLGIRSGFKGANACIVNQGTGGALAILEAASALRAGEAARAMVVGHHTPVEPQQVLYYHGLGLLAEEALRPFDAERDGTVLGEGSAALILESESSARGRGAHILGEFLGGGCASEGEGLLAVREDGDGPARAMSLALADAGLEADAVGLIVAHGNGTRRSDASEARALKRVFGRAAPPITASKWAFGHILDGAGILDAVLALMALRRGEVPGIAALRELDPDCAGLPIAAASRTPRSDVALVHSRGFGGMNAALVFRARQ